MAIIFGTTQKRRNVALVASELELSIVTIGRFIHGGRPIWKLCVFDDHYL
jgi:hypothetical protein